MREDFENWWEKEGQYSELCGKELCIIAWSNGEYKAFKELTDEEIVDCVDNIFGLMALQTKYVMDIDQIQQCGIELARAILKKASEK